MATDMLTWARRQVFDQFGLSSSERFVLLLLADNASWNEESGGWYAFPFQKTLARESGLSERTVRRSMTRLLDLGVISAEKRIRASGFVAGNGYIFHPEVVDNPVTLTDSDAVETAPDEGKEPDRWPGFPGEDTVTSLEIAREDTMSGLEIAGEDTVSGTPRDRHDAKTGHGDRRTQWPVGPDTVAGPARADREDVCARLNRHSESSSSCGEEATAGAVGDEDDEGILSTDGSTADRGSDPAMSDQWRGVNLAIVAEQIHELIGLDCQRESLQWVIDSILARSRRRVGRPASFVRADRERPRGPPGGVGGAVRVCHSDGGDGRRSAGGFASVPDPGARRTGPVGGQLPRVPGNLGCAVPG